MSKITSKTLTYIETPLQQVFERRSGGGSNTTFLTERLRRINMFKWLFKRRRNKDLKEAVEKTEQLVTLQETLNDLLREEDEIINKKNSKKKK